MKRTSYINWNFIVCKKRVCMWKNESKEIEERRQDL